MRKKDNIFIYIFELLQVIFYIIFVWNHETGNLIQKKLNSLSKEAAIGSNLKMVKKSMTTSNIVVALVGDFQDMLTALESLNTQNSKGANNDRTLQTYIRYAGTSVVL